MRRELRASLSHLPPSLVLRYVNITSSCHRVLPPNRSLSSESLFTARELITTGLDAPRLKHFQPVHVARFYGVVSKNTNELKTGAPGRFGLEGSRLGWQWKLKSSIMSTPIQRDGGEPSRGFPSEARLGPYGENLGERGSLGKLPAALRPRNHGRKDEDQEQRGKSRNLEPPRVCERAHWLTPAPMAGACCG